MIYREELGPIIREKALQFLGLAYLEGMEQLGDGQESVLAELVSAVRSKDLSELCSYFWTLRGDENGKKSYGHRILEFWREVSASIQQSGSRQPELLSALSLLAAFLEDVTPDVEQLLAEAAPFAEVGHHG